MPYVEYKLGSVTKTLTASEKEKDANMGTSSPDPVLNPPIAGMSVQCARALTL